MKQHAKPAAVSKLTSKYQATVPKSVREALSLHAGDQIAFEIVRGQVRLRKADPIDLEYLASIESGLGEWSSDADTQAYDFR
jgi:AbrB family looped-hinge helix DNA binding protein